MTIVINGREDYVQRITIYFKAEGFADSDYYNIQETRFPTRPEPKKSGVARKQTNIVISKGGIT